MRRLGERFVVERLANFDGFASVKEAVHVGGHRTKKSTMKRCPCTLPWCLLPATKVVPKELLPVFDTPSLQHTIDEAARAGINHVIVVSNRAKPAVEAFADQATGTVKVSVVYQDSPRGLGHAVECARELVGDASFAVLLPDELLGDSSHLQSLIAEHEKSGKSVIGLKQVPRNEVSAYGCVTPQGVPDGSSRHHR
ncbi:MAG: hypothetical protein EBT38_05315 [Acidimicrobiia bacterium]|nr:hypothetical protein [Acidimicrobiia bacterium]